MAQARITLTRTRFNELAIRQYRDVSRIGVPGHSRPFKDSWLRYVDLQTDDDIGPSFKTMGEAQAGLAEYAEQFGATLAA